MKTAKLFASLEKPQFERKRNFLAVKHNNEYAIIHGKVCNENGHMQPKIYRKKLDLENRPYSSSKFVKFNKKEFMVGPLARINTNHKNLSKDAKKALKTMKLELPNYSPFSSNLARIAELVQCIDQSIEIIKNIRLKEEKAFDFRKLKNKKNLYEGSAVTEAPRGILYHSYRINKNGMITGADIITPTAKNLLCIENDIRYFIPSIIKKPRDKIIIELEKLVRSYDPCLSCSTHFLEVNFL
jgi:coenzyme F420-reducing hydrogenase alpha subunit